MMKTVLMFATAALAALSLSAVAGNKVSAATQTADTKANITLTTDTNAGDGSGKIQLVQAPDFNFDSQAINASADTTATTTGTKSLEVINPGVAATWNVAVNAGEFKSTEEGSSTTLKGATLALAGAVSADDNAKNKAVYTPATLSNSAANGIFKSTTIDGGFSGVGTNAEDLTATLSIPAGNVAGSYQADLTWTLTQTPDTDAE